MKGILLILVLVIVSYAAGCGKSEPKDVIGKVDGKAITMSMLEEKIKNLPASYQTAASQHKKEVLDDMIVEELLYKEARARKLHRDPEVIELMDEAARKILIAKVIDIELKKSVPVSDDDVKQYYQEHKEQYMVPQMIRASHILTNTEEEANKALEELNAGASFGELASKYSKDLTKDRNGDLGFFKKGQMIPEFENACFSLKVGDVSGVVETRFGYHIIKLTDRKDSTYRKLEEVEDNIRTLISRARNRERFEEVTKVLKDRASISIYEDFVEEPPVEGPEGETSQAKPSPVTEEVKSEEE